MPRLERSGQMTFAVPTGALVSSDVGDVGTAVFLPAFGLSELVLFYAKFDHVLETVGSDETRDYGWVDQ